VVHPVYFNDRHLDKSWEEKRFCPELQESDRSLAFYVKAQLISLTKDPTPETSWSSKKRHSPKYWWSRNKSLRWQRSK